MTAMTIKEIDYLKSELQKMQFAFGAMAEQLFAERISNQKAIKKLTEELHAAREHIEMYGIAKLLIEAENRGYAQAMQKREISE